MTKESRILKDRGRKRVLMSGTLYTPDGAFSVRIRDMSRSGVHLFADSRLPSDCDVIFKRGSLFIAGRIAWSNNGDAGVEFYRQLSDSDAGLAGLPI